jgi:hypothetical protein
MSGFRRWLSQTSQSRQHICDSCDTQGSPASNGDKVSQKSQVSQSRARALKREPPTGAAPNSTANWGTYDDVIKEEKKREIQRVRESHPATPATFATPPHKGDCYTCCQSVTRLGPLAGLVNWLGDAVHLHCPAPPPEAAAPQPDPDQFDEEGYAALRQDLITVIKDLAAEGKKAGQIARMFGLKPHEVWRVLRGQYG